MRFSKPRPLTAAQHFHALRHNPACIGEGSLGIAGFTWHYEARPTPISRSYLLQINFRTGGKPSVYVDLPDLPALAEGRKIPHLYSSNPVSLCLYLPRTREWGPHMQIASSVVPWASLWLFYFEEWLVSDDWKGGGEHVSDRDLKCSSKSKERAAKSGRANLRMERT